MNTKTILTAILTSAALATALGSAHGQQVILKKAPAADQRQVVQPPKPAARPSTPSKTTAAPPQVVKPAAPPAPAVVNSEKYLRSAAAALKKRSETAKTNAELAKIVSEADIKIDLGLPGAAVIEPVTVYFVEQKSFFGGIFSQIKQSARMNGNDDPSVLRTKDGRKVLDSVKMAGQLRLPGASSDVIEAAMEYARARNEIVDIEVWVESEVEAMTLQNKFTADPIVRGIKVLPGKKNRLTFILPAEGNVREWKEIDLSPDVEVPVVAHSKPGQVVQSGVVPAPVASPITINSPDLCPDSNFFARPMCETNLCNERPDLAGHPSCVKVREMEAAQREQMRM